MFKQSSAKYCYMRRVPCSSLTRSMSHTSFVIHRRTLTSRSTEKTSNMFGTLIICLPSEHVGGAVYLIHGPKEKTFATAELSAFSTTYIAW